MKLLYILLSTLLLAVNSFAQSPGVVASEFVSKIIPKASAKQTCETVDPLPSSVFDKMVVQDITYAIVGEATPTNGVKVDVVKPEITITAAYTPESAKVPFDIFSLDLKAGATDRNISILKGGGNINTAFEIRPSFHFIPRTNSAKYGECVDALPKTILIDANNRLVRRYATAVKDSFQVSRLIQNTHLHTVGNVDDAELAPLQEPLTPEQRLVVMYFVRKAAKTPVLSFGDTESLTQMLAKVPVAGATTTGTITKLDLNTYQSGIVADYERFRKKLNTIESDTTAKLIKNASEIWTRKQYTWFTVSPVGKAEKVTERYTQFKGKDSLHFKTDYRFSAGITGYLNYYIVNTQKRANFWRIGASLLYSNNMTTLSGYNYETRKLFFANGAGITEQTESGKAYNNEDVKTGWVRQLGLEYYRLPLKSFVPGVYVSGNFNNSALYKLPKVVGRENDKTKMEAEGGLIFNVNSREKDKEKTIVSLLLYGRYEDVTDKRRTSNRTGIQESQEDFRKRNVAFGLRVGIPINLPKRS